MSLRLRIFWGKWQDQKCNTFHNGTNIIMKSNFNSYYPATANNLFTTSESPKIFEFSIFFSKFCCKQNIVFCLIKSRAKYWNHATFSNSDCMGVQFKALNYVVQNYLKKSKKFVWTIGQFEFEYYWGSDVMNKLLIPLYTAPDQMLKPLNKLPRLRQS